MTNVRNIAPGDEAAWRRMWAAYCAYYKVSLTETVTAATWRRIHDPVSPIAGLVAERDGALVGLANYVVHPNTWSAGDVCYLEDLFVDPGARGTGAGRALIDRLVAMAREHGWARVYWHTETENSTARRLYDRYRPADPFVRYTITL